MKHQELNPATIKNSRKYEAPELRVHGGLSAITQAVGMSGMMDGGGGGNDKSAA